MQHPLHHGRYRAQGMVEYIIIIVVVGIFCIGMFMAMGRGLEMQGGHTTLKLVSARVHNMRTSGTHDPSKVSFQPVWSERVRRTGMSQE